MLCEKPLAMDAADARAMVEAAQRAKRTAMTCFNWRFPAAMQRLHAMVEAGFLGRLFHINVRYFAPRFADEEVAPTPVNMTPMPWHFKNNAILRLFSSVKMG